MTISLTIFSDVIMSIQQEITLPSLNDTDISDPSILRNKAEEIKELSKKIELNMNTFKLQSEECYKKHSIDDGKYNEKKVQRCEQEISHFHDLASQLIFRSYNLLNTDPSIINITGLSSEEAIKRIEKRINTLKSHGILHIKSEDSEHILHEVGSNIMKYLENQKINSEITSTSLLLHLSSNNSQASSSDGEEVEISKELAKEIMIPESYITSPIDFSLNINQCSSLMEEKEKLLKEGHEYRHKIEEYKIEIDKLKERNEKGEKEENEIKEIELKIKECCKKSSEILFKAYNIFNDNSSIDIREQSYEDSIEYIKNGLKEINNLKELIIIGDGSDSVYMNEIKQLIINNLKENEKLIIKEDEPHEGWMRITFNEEIIKINQTPNSNEDIEDNGIILLKSNSTIPPTAIMKESMPNSPTSPNSKVNENGNGNAVKRRRASTAVPEHANNPVKNGNDIQCCVIF